MTRSILIYSESHHLKTWKKLTEKIKRQNEGEKEENQLVYMASVALVTSSMSPVDGTNVRWRERAPNKSQIAQATHRRAAAASSRCSVSHTTIPKLVAATLCGLRPFALPRSLIPPKSHAALVSFNQQHQPSLEAKLALLLLLPSTIYIHHCRRRRGCRHVRWSTP